MMEYYLLFFKIKFILVYFSLQIHYSTTYDISSSLDMKKKVGLSCAATKFPLDDKLVFSESFFPRKKTEGWGELFHIVLQQLTTFY